MNYKDITPEMVMSMDLQELVKLDYAKLPEKSKLAVIKKDPVMWAKAFISSYSIEQEEYVPWTARWYQAEMLRDRSLRKVYRCGRRCIAGDTLIYDPETNSSISAKELFNTRQDNFFTVACLDHDFKAEQMPLAKIYENGVKQVYIITTEYNKQITVTENHPFLTQVGWKELKHLRVGNLIAVIQDEGVLSKYVDIDKQTIELIQKELNKEVSIESYSDLMLYAEEAGLETVYDILDGDLAWERIKSIRLRGTEMTYDVSVPEYHNFIANGFITHNTGKTETMVIEALYNCFTRDNFVHMFVTPYENQVRLIFDNLKSKIDSSPRIRTALTRSTRSPYVMEFNNKSKIVGFTTGASSGSSAASIRGWRSDWISLDEMDFE